MSNPIYDKLDKILKLNEALQKQASESSACIIQLSAKVESLQANIDMMKSEGFRDLIRNLESTKSFISKKLLNCVCIVCK